MVGVAVGVVVVVVVAVVVNYMIFPTPPNPSILLPEQSGLWVCPPHKGQGFHIFVGEWAEFFWYTLDADEKPVWYSGGGVGNTFDIIKTDGDRNEIDAGTVSLNLEDGTLYMHTYDHGRVTLPIERQEIAFSMDERNGPWIDDNHDEAGFTMQFFNFMGERVTAPWFTYRDGRQWWYICTGEWYPAGKRYDLKIAEARGKCMTPGDAEENGVGRAKLRATDEGFEFNYTLRGEAGVRNLRRL